eukprot:9325368-Alexandrium_andersonii.AAC.1
MTRARKGALEQFQPYDCAGQNARMNPQTQRGYSAFVQAKLSCIIGASGVHGDAMGVVMMEDDSPDRKAAVLVQCDDADGSYGHQRWSGQ